MQDGKAFIGYYGVGKRTEGTDTLPYNALPKILKAIDELQAKDYVDAIICEGDRINNRRFFDHILAKGYEAKLWLVEAPISISMARLQRAGSKITETFVKGTRTKSANMYALYGRFLHGTKVNGG